jgi:hypothetical protein
MIKTYYQITFLNLETNRRDLYCGGILFEDEESVKAERKLLVAEQELKPSKGEARTRSDFQIKKVKRLKMFVAS